MAEGGAYNTSQKSGALQEVLNDARNPETLYRSPAYVGLISLMTLGGRLPFRLGLASLASREAAMVTATIGQGGIFLVHPESPEFSGCNVLVTHSAFGKLSLYRQGEEEPGPSEEVLGGMAFPQWLLDMAADDAAAEELLDRVEQAKLDAMLIEWEAQGVIHTKVHQVMDWVDRVETVYIFLGRQVFSRSDGGSNTLIKDGLLRALLDRSVGEWTTSERLFVAAAHLLFQTGRAVRFEEFNGRQLTAIELRRWLVQKYCMYIAALGEEQAQDPMAASFYDLALSVGQLGRQLDEAGWVRFRRISGITYGKNEHLIPPSRCPQVTELPASLAELGGTLQVEIDPAQPLWSVSQITRAALEEGRRAGTFDLVHQIINQIVLSAVVESKADYGMSSSLRSPGRLRGEAGQRAAGVLGLAKTDFYCCVLPHPDVVTSLPDQVMGQILYSAALRMEFNRWHFIPGNFTREEVPVERHYYFPPLMPDVAEWADLRHSGHTRAGVRYSVRAPGPSLWTPPLVAYDHPYRGFYDIRLVRMEGLPFNKDEMLVAVRHTRLMSAVWEEIQKFVEAYDHTAPVVTGYTKDWYMQGQWKNALDRVAILL